MSAQNNAALAHKIYQLFNQNKLDEALTLTTEDVEIVLIPFGQTFHGREGLREVMQGCKRAFPNLQITEITYQLATADGVVNEFKARGVHTGMLITTAGQAPRPAGWWNSRSAKCGKCARASWLFCAITRMSQASYASLGWLSKGAFHFVRTRRRIP